MIELHNLTPRQHQLADQIWACDTQQDVDDLLLQLPPADRADAKGLIELMILESQEAELDRYYAQAQQVLSKL
jgi:hypothetical protein